MYSVTSVKINNFSSVLKLQVSLEVICFEEVFINQVCVFCKSQILGCSAGSLKYFSLTFQLFIWEFRVYRKVLVVRILLYMCVFVTNMHIYTYKVFHLKSYVFGVRFKIMVSDY